MPKTKDLSLLKNYRNKFNTILTKRESVASHEFMITLIKYYQVSGFDFIPQGDSTKGQIDYFYIPQAHTDINYFVELKKLGQLEKMSEKDIDKLERKYLLSAFPDELREAGRTDGIRVLIVVDGKSARIRIRNKTYGNTTPSFAISMSGSRPEQLYPMIAPIFEDPVQFLREAVWLNEENCLKLIEWDLNAGSRSSLRSEITSAWRQRIGFAKGEHWQDRYENALSELFSATKGDSISSDADTLREVFRLENALRLVKQLFANYVKVPFKQGEKGIVFW